MSPWAPVPRLGTSPRLGENDRVSWVRFSSSTLSLPLTGTGSGVGVAVLSGRKMVLKPLPRNVPVKAVSGPSGATGVTAVLGAVRFDTSRNLKPLGTAKAFSRFRSLTGSSWDRAHPVHPGALLADLL